MIWMPGAGCQIPDAGEMPDVSHRSSQSEGG